jgi:arylsulfatase A-like enzyme
MYDAEIRYTDDQLARLFVKLHEWGLENEVIVAVVSDHGDHFGEHGQYFHHRTLYQEVIHVPMVVRASGLIEPGTRSSASVSIYDIGPTLLDLAGLSTWPERSGRSALPLLKEGNHEVMMDLLHPGQKLDLRGWRQGMEKAVWDTRGGTFGIWDLAKDPGEMAPNWISDPEQTATSAAASEAFRQADLAPGVASPMTEDSEMKRRLAELGYIDG